jgi:hypothetical protein
MFVLLLGLALSNLTWAFKCYYTLAKDSCWTPYNVSVTVSDGSTATDLFTVTIPAGQQWVRKEFECSKTQALKYIATFTPIFWESGKGKTFPALRAWYLPGKINSGDSAWEIPVCYPKDFSNVPLPPDAKGNCACDFSPIPPIKSSFTR